MSKLTETGSLRFGIEYPVGSGQMHYDFVFRLPTVGDNIAAIEEVGVDSNLKLNVAMLARGLVKLGDIPEGELTYAMLENMVDEDYDVISAARGALRKKRMRPSNTLPESGAPSSSSVATESANQQQEA